MLRRQEGREHRRLRKATSVWRKHGRSGARLQGIQWGGGDVPQCKPRHAHMLLRERKGGEVQKRRAPDLHSASEPAASCYLCRPGGNVWRDGPGEKTVLAPRQTEGCDVAQQTLQCPPA